MGPDRQCAPPARPGHPRGVGAAAGHRGFYTGTGTGQRHLATKRGSSDTGTASGRRRPCINTAGDGCGGWAHDRSPYVAASTPCWRASGRGLLFEPTRCRAVQLNRQVHYASKCPRGQVKSGVIRPEGPFGAACQWPATWRIRRWSGWSGSCWRSRIGSGTAGVVTCGP